MSAQHSVDLSSIDQKEENDNVEVDGIKILEAEPPFQKMKSFKDFIGFKEI